MGSRVKKKMSELSIFFTWIYILIIVHCDGAIVTDVEPKYGSLAGETRLTIYGKAFSADQFSQNDDPNTGNKVYLVGTSGTEDSCTVHKDGCTETQVMCYTKRGMSEEDHYVKVVVDGVVVDDVNLCDGVPTNSKCTYKPQLDNTPTIETFSPQSGLPGSFVTMYGKLISDRYGSNVAMATNGKTQQLLRVYVGPQDCGLKANDVFYGFALDDEDSDYGTLRCKSKGTSVGFYNASFILESPYGRSQPETTLYRVAYNDHLYMFQTYTNITSISPSSGSVAGGLVLTIYGNYFDNRAPYVQPRAYTGDAECEIIDVLVDEYITCNVAADPQYPGPNHAGNRGVNFEYWTSMSKDASSLDSILSLTSSSSGYHSDPLDETYFHDVDDSMDNFASRITTYFTPPHSGIYRFFLNADDGARLYIDGIVRVTSAMAWETSSKMTLDKNTRYLLEVVHYETSGDAFIHLKVKYFDTAFTSAWTGNAVQEVQAISIASTVTDDVQKLEFKNFANQTASSEVQTVEVTILGQFRFGLYGVYTERLTTDMDEATIQDALNALPIFGSEESIIVARIPTAMPSFELTFVSNRGDFPDINVVEFVGNSSVPSSQYEVMEDIKGTPDVDTVALSLEGIVSLPFAVATLDAASLDGVIHGMLEAKCPQVFASPSLAKYYESFEADSSLFAGTIVKDTEPFCGRYVLKHPFQIYKKPDKEFGIMLPSYGVLCFAYKGFLKSYIRVTFSYKSTSDEETKTETRYFPYSFNIDSDTVSETWYYMCMNVYSEVYNLYPGDTEHRLDEVRVYSLNAYQPGYVDSVFIGRDVTTDDPEVNLRRLPPSRPNNALINEVVISNISSTVYSVTLKPYECGNEFPLFELANGRVTSGQLSFPSSAVTSTLDNCDGAISVTRTSEASPPVTGLIDVTFNGKTKAGLNISLDPKDFDRELESLNGIGSVSVDKKGDCANFDMSVKFLTLPGDQPEMTVSYGQLAGIGPMCSISTYTDGGLFYTPLTGDMVSTVHPVTQVRLFINDVPTVCAGDCSFQWDLAVTPTVTDITPSTGTSALATSVIISGSGFSSELSENNVSIGEVVCTVTAAAATSITCDVGNGPIGSYQVIVNVDGMGYGQHLDGNVMFEYTANITGISPSTGSLGGGVLLTISGYGFKAGANVTINSASCDITSVEPAQIECLVPAMTTDGTHDVVVDQVSMSLFYSGFTYDSSLTATVNDVSPSKLGVQGGTLTITGSSFTSSEGFVRVGIVMGTIMSWTDTQIEVDIGNIAPGTHYLLVATANGRATDGSGNIPNVIIDLSITNVFPLHGSVLGGTRLTVTGSGFGTNYTIVDASVGDIVCNVATVTDTQLVCEIANAATTHEVTNKGSDPAYGEFYAYDQPYITVNLGEFVTWSWETPSFINDIAHSVIEVDSPSATTPTLGGFTSGTPSANGQYTHQFTETGTFYVWSGFVDRWAIKSYTGTVDVVSATSRLEEISVHVTGIEALHNVGGDSDPIDNSSCGAVTNGTSLCSDSLPTGGDPTKFNFAFWTCSTPVINLIDFTNGTVQTSITITGEGLSDIICQNEVSFGDFSCDVTSSDSTAVTCTLAKSGEPDLGVIHPLAVRVGNRGHALVNITSAEDRGFGLIPNIEFITPTTGSMAGGARLTITGFGFAESPSVSIGIYPCNVIESSYSEIICESPESSSEVERDIEVQAYVDGIPQSAECETDTKTCRFTYSSLWTPIIMMIDPDTMSSSTTFSITGASFGTNTGEIEVSIGEVSATVTAVTFMSITANVDNIPAGINDVVVKVKDYGKASGSLTMYGTPTVSTITPSSGSIYGETYITIQGNGFVENDTIVAVGGAVCLVNTTTLSEVTCYTTPHAAGSVSVDVSSNGHTFTPATYVYDTGSSPTITSISPTSGIASDTLTITGSNLNGGAVTVNLYDAECAVVSSSITEIVCTIGQHATGSVYVYVFVEGLGGSNVDQLFEYQLSVTSISPTQGGTAGGQTVVLSGTGFDDSAMVTVCGQMCNAVSSISSQYTCKTPANSAETCDVVVAVNGLTSTLAGSYKYDADITPAVTGVTPVRGGTGGGTIITVSGSGFGGVAGNIEVAIDGAECVVSSATTSEIVCVTGPHLGSADTKVEVQISGNGIAEEASVGCANFSYIDVWSSSFTWGGGPVPEAGEFIIIPKGMTLLLDTDTPVLSFLLIQGGKLIFDDKDVELKSNIIMLTDGGVLQVGTEAEPFQHKGIITLYGHHRSKELPIYGTKVLAVRNGTLDLHGIEVPLTWTRLAVTASAGSNTIVLMDPVEWNIDDEIIIASTGHKHSQSENEKMTIASISSDKLTLTLDTVLEADHSGTEETFDGTLVEFRAEVGLLTHNVVVRGNTDPDWEDEITACAAGFDTGEFVTQTCFLGRFGDEIGSSQFGAMILVHAPVYDTHEAQARISYTEVTFAGQAFRLGRYPIHFHLNGDMSSSYVRGCGIHKTFNRAVNIHGTHNTLVEKTVIYNIMGGAFFLEDGIETGNTIQYNLAVFVRESSSLLNDDITPASFWVTNPNNSIQHNAAAGGTHFGYWYRMHKHPDGPSFTPTVCPVNVPLGIFYNNTAHSFGWFGLWIFDDYFPLKGGCDGTEVEPAVFRGLFSWNNDKGAEAVFSGAVQFVDFILVQNKLAGYEGKKVLEVPQYTDESPMLKDSLIVGITTAIPNSEQGCTTGGVVFPFGAGFRVVNVRFVNFQDSNNCTTFSWTRIDGTCTQFCGGYTYHTEGLTFINAPSKGRFAWDWEGVILDKDGTATGKSANWTVLPTSGSLPLDCEPASEFSIGEPASVCPPQYKWHRFAFNNIVPTSIEGKNFLITNQYGTSSVPYAKKRLSHKPGWMCALVDGETYSFAFENAEQINNISFDGQFYDFQDSDYIFMTIEVELMPDRFSFDGGNTYINASVTIDPYTAENGDWQWDDVNSIVTFVVHGRKRSRRGMSTYSVDRPLSYTTYKCYYDNCIPPPDPNTIPPASMRPTDFEYWDDTTRWDNSTNDSYVSNYGGSYGIPEDYNNVRIAFGTWMTVNKTTTFNKLATLLLEGVLEFIDTPGAVYKIEADFIIIKGGRLIIGWPEDQFDGLATITLRGDHSSSYHDPGDGPTLGSKAIGVFGGLDLFGMDVGITWTLLATKGVVGDTQIVLAQQVQWSAGDKIVIGPTGFDPWQTESFEIVSVETDNVTLTLSASLKYLHTVHKETLSNGKVVDVGAAVGLLSHNIRIVGQDYHDLYKESFGARVLVGLVTSQGQTYTGYARLSNVEFYHAGQEGFTEEYDPRFQLAYVATGTVSHVKPSSVTKCSFHNGFNTAVGAFGIGSLNVSDNVVFGSVGNGLRTSSNDTRLINNLVALMVATNTYQDREETFNPRWEAGIEAMKATELILQDNLVTGSERIAYHIMTQDCDDTSDRYSNNKAYANVLGFVVLPEDKLAQTDCAKISGHTAWKTHDFGIYYQNALSLIAENNLLIENSNGLIAIVLKPDAVSHGFANKTVQVRNTTFVGQTDSFDCSSDVTPIGDANFELSGTARPVAPPTTGMVGLIFPNFYQKSNMAPGKPWKGCMAYNAIGGLMTLSDVTFVKYTTTACKTNYAVSTNNGNDDGQHPIESTDITLIDVDHSNKIFYHRPNVDKINGADCVDMDCDALKKALFKDLDGTFLGHVGSVVPQSEFEWDVNEQRGLGNYRIPKEMVTDMDGNRIPYDTIAPHHGVIRNENCTIQSSWQAYECFEELNYEMLMIESMDEDTETRRLSPVAILGDGYMDLINGPQDHGWCSGYTCRLRLSTFMALVVTDEEFLVHFTSVTPKHMRYRLLNVDQDEGIKLTVWYSRSNRLDVFLDDTFIMATNVRIDGNGRYISSMPQGNEFEPQIVNGSGTNFFNKDTGELTFIIMGQQKVDVITQETVIVSFGIPDLTVDDFYGDDMVENLANFLNIPLSKVRIVNVVSASSSRRRKRSGEGISVEIEIGNEPVSGINDTTSNSVDYSALLQLASDIVNECQVGNISESFNIPGACETVEVPSLDPGTPPIVYNTPSPDYLFFSDAAESMYEGVPLKTQPLIRAADISNNVVIELGTTEYPWQLTASLRPGTGHVDAMLNGTKTVNCSDGWFNYTDLAISHMGAGYILDFNVSFPVEAENFTLTSDPLDVAGRPLQIHVYDKTSGDIVRNARFSVTLDLQDPNTEDIITDISWRDHTWTAEASMLGSSPYGSLDGILTSTFGVSTGRAMFPDLNLTGIGMFYVQFHVLSDPPDFNLTLNHKFSILNPAHIGMTIEEESEVKVKFAVDYDTVLPTEDKKNEFESNILTEYSNLWPDVQLTVGSISEGSIIVTFVIAGTSANVNATAYNVCDSIYNQTSYSYNGYTLALSPFLTINNQTYYGVTCGDLSEDDDDEGLAVYLIMLIVLLCLVLVVGIVAIVIWKCTIKPKTQTHVMTHGSQYVGFSDGLVEDCLFKDVSFASLNFKSGDYPAPPLATKINVSQLPRNDYYAGISSPCRHSIVEDVLSSRSSTIDVADLLNSDTSSTVFSSTRPSTTVPSPDVVLTRNTIMSTSSITMSTLDAELSMDNELELTTRAENSIQVSSPIDILEPGQPSPSRSASPMLHRVCTPVFELENPMPPVGEAFAQRKF